jgi:hypothetical protein
MLRFILRNSGVECTSVSEGAGKGLFELDNEPMISVKGRKLFE